MIERVEYQPRKEVYNPGDVIYMAIYFREPFVGQCEAGLVPRGGQPPADFRRSIFARSGDKLYEGQVHVWEGLSGSCVLLVRLAAARGAARTIFGGDQIFEIRPIRP